MGKLRILFILHYPPPIHGSSLVGGFIKESCLINERFHGIYINLGTSLSVEEIGKNIIGKLRRYLKLIREVISELRTNKPDLCYMTISSKGAGFYKDTCIVMLIRLFGVRRIYHFHNKGISSRQERFIDNLLYGIVFDNADVILLSKCLYPDLQKYVPEARVHFCSNGIPDLNGGMSKFDQKNISSVPEILFLSHLIESKGVFILVDALRIVKERCLSFHCSMIGGEGDVTMRQMKDRIESAGLMGFVDVVGKKYGEEKHAAFRKADVFIHPTFNDCLPLVLLEAMQHSLPIVSTPEGAIPDVVEDGVTGFLVPQRDAQALADKLELLIQDSGLRQRMSSAGRARYEAQFTLEKFEKRLTDILSQVTATNPDSN